LFLVVAQDYVVVLLRNGRRKDEATKEPHDDVKSTRSVARRLHVHSVPSSMQVNHEPEAETQKTVVIHKKRLGYQKVRGTIDR
ncbi:hypothetical protein ACJX0J_025191, partial [Zea mays]